MLRTLTVAALALLMLTAACNRTEPADKEPGDRLLALQGGPVAFKCREIVPVIPVNGSVEGKTCTENKAVINGWSLLCVVDGQCNTPARLAELNQAAEDFCAQWCAKKNCAYRYTKRDRCDSSHCLQSKDCQKNCDGPLRDSCYFQQRAPNFNCQCLERVVE